MVVRLADEREDGNGSSVDAMVERGVDGSVRRKRRRVDEERAVVV